MGGGAVIFDVPPEPVYAAHQASDWRSLIQQAMVVLWPELPDGSAWIESQVQVESGGDPRAVSRCGAVGLMQLLPSTADEVGVANIYDPTQNLRGGIVYLRQQYENLSRIPNHSDRLRWAWASYNGGRGYVNRALAIAQVDAEHNWWAFHPCWRYLFHRDCEVALKVPDYKQVHHYVEKIESHAATLGVRL